MAREVACPRYSCYAYTALLLSIAFSQRDLHWTMQTLIRGFSTIFRARQSAEIQISKGDLVHEVVAENPASTLSNSILAESTRMRKAII
ncbi:hypothetical protein BBP40_011441, partial [Aspergillus hancockii]